MKKLINASIGFVSGILNGLFGSGGGVAAVPLLEASGLEAKKSHATSVALIFLLSIISVIIYGFNGNLDYETALKYIPYGLVGAVLGAVLLKKVPNSLLRRIFGGVILISAVKILLG